MLTLCGFSASNYYNKVKLALLEKGLPFTEELACGCTSGDAKATPIDNTNHASTRRASQRRLRRVCRDGKDMEAPL